MEVQVQVSCVPEILIWPGMSRLTKKHFALTRSLRILHPITFWNSMLVGVSSVVGLGFGTIGLGLAAAIHC